MDLPLLSATQIELFDESRGGCERRWGFKYIDRIFVEQHPAAALGTEVQDTQIDPYLATGRGFDFTRKSGEIAQKLVPLLPKPMSPGMKLRRKFLMPSPRGTFAYQGEFDLWAPSASIVPGLESSSLQLLGDIKTTGNLDYAKTEETLATDIQSQLYAMDVMYEENVDELDLVWFYSKTRKPYRAQRVHLRVSAPHVVEQFQRIDEIGSRVVAIKLASPKVEDLKPNPRMCDKYPPHGCPYRHKCNLSPSVHAAAVNLEAVLETKTNDFLAGLRKQQTAAVAAAPVPTAPVMAPVHVGAGMHVPAVPLAFAPGGAFAGLPAPAPTHTPEPERHTFEVPAPSALPAWATSPVDPRHAAKINPPEAALPPAPPVGHAPAPANIPPTPPAVAPVEAPKRGRPAGSKNAPTAAPSGGPSLEEVITLASLMKQHGIKRLAFDGGQVCEVEVGS